MLRLATSQDASTDVAFMNQLPLMCKSTSKQKQREHCSMELQWNVNVAMKTIVWTSQDLASRTLRELAISKPVQSCATDLPDEGGLAFFPASIFMEATTCRPVFVFPDGAVAPSAIEVVLLPRPGIMSISPKLRRKLSPFLHTWNNDDGNMQQH